MAGGDGVGCKEVEYEYEWKEENRRRVITGWTTLGDVKGLDGGVDIWVVVVVVVIVPDKMILEVVIGRYEWGCWCGYDGDEYRTYGVHGHQG